MIEALTFLLWVAGIVIALGAALAAVITVIAVVKAFDSKENNK